MPPAREQPLTEATRTFLFADLRDYTSFVEARGDQAAAALVATFRQLVRQRVRESAGAEVKVEGDAIFVAFPSARQAIVCGAAILQDASKHTGAMPDLPMRVGIGLHAGEPVPQDGDFIGAAVNVAARIGAAAGAGQLLVSDVVRGLVRSGAPFRLQDRGPVLLKGLGEPVHLYEVLWSAEQVADSAALVEGSLLPFPRPPAAPTSVSPLVGRSSELSTLRERVSALKRRRGGTVLVAGDAGIGKSRLVREAIADSGERSVILYGACGLSEAPPPFEPFVAAIRAILREADAEAALQRTAPELLTLIPESTAARQNAPDRDRLFGAYLRLLRQYARAAPTALVVEDLHWADEGTLAMLEFLIAQADPTPFLVVGTYRADEVHRRHRLRPVLAALARRADVETVMLAPLPAQESLDLLRGNPGLESASPSQLTAISQRAEGNPLFLEELARNFQSGRVEGVPASLAETVLLRIARAGEPAGRLLNYLAVIGARASYDLLEPLMASEAALLESARAAVEEHLAGEDGDGLAFRHALIREAILGDLMTRERRALHRAVGETIERLHGEAPEQAGEIARHLGAAGLQARALPYALKAGERAFRMHATEEAARQYEHAVEWSAAGSEQRMLALFGLGRAYARLLLVRKALATYREALELARALGHQEHIAAITMYRTFSMPWGRDEYAAWQAAWDAAELLGKHTHLARIASGLARRAHLYFEDDQAAAWLERALLEARQAGSRDVELRALRLQCQFQHPPGWQAEEERYVREQLDSALSRDVDVLDAYRDMLVRRCRESDQAEREHTLQAARTYGERLAIPQAVIFRHGIVWMSWLDGNWPRALALWEEVRSRWTEDAPDIYPDAGPIAAAIDIEAHGPDAGRAQLIRATARIRKTETWRGLLAAAAHEANLWLAEGRPEKVLEALMPILERRRPVMLDIESFALATRVVLPAALLAEDREVLGLWIDDAGVAQGGAFQSAGVDQARAIAALLDREMTRADELFAMAAASHQRRGWMLLAHEMAWQRAMTGTPEASEAVRAAATFYEGLGAAWRRVWLEARAKLASGP